MAADGSILIDSKLDTKGLDSGLKRLGGGLSKFGKMAADGKGLDSGLKRLGGGLSKFGEIAAAGIAAATAAIAAFGVASFKAAEEAASSNARILNITESMGLYGDQASEVTDRLIDLANKTALATGVDNDSIKATQAKLLTFKEIASSAGEVGGAFDRATAAAIDLAAAGFGEAESNAVQLGKALNDPIKGITALTRSGVTFTEAEKEKIKVLTESGNVLEAQDMILQAIETQVGGTAEATADSSKRIGQAFDQIKESAGTSLLTAFDEVAPSLLTALEGITPLIEDAFSGVAGVIEVVGKAVSGFVTVFTDGLNSGLTPMDSFKQAIESSFGGDVAAIFTTIVDTAQGLIDVLTAVATWVTDNRGWLEPIVVGVVAMVAAFKAWTAAKAAWVAIVQIATAAQAAFNAVMAANPIGIIILAIVGLVAAFLYLWNTNEGFRQFFLDAWDAISGAFSTAWEAITAGLAAMGAFFTETWESVKSGATAVVKFFKGLPGKIATAVSTIASKIGEKFQDALDTVKGIFSIDTLITTGKDLIRGLWNGINNMRQWIKDKISGFTAGIVKDIKGFFGIKSPSKLFETEIGVNLALGLGKGFDKGLPDVMADMRRSINAEMGRFSMMGSGSTTSNLTVNFNQPQTSYSDTLAAMRRVEMGLAW